MRKILIFIIITFFSLLAFGQTKGTVYGIDETGKNTPLPFANIYFSEIEKGVSTDAKGIFNIALPEKKSYQAIVSYVGYQTDTVQIVAGTKNNKINLKAGESLDAVEVKARNSGSMISMMTPFQTETITTHGLQKLACCNLSESFENDPTVDVGYSDAVSGVKHIRMLGLDGKYSLMLSDGMPSLRGLASMYGLTFIPGAWLRSIGISKGASTVEHGYESITGQINAGLIDPIHSDPFYFNVYGNNELRFEGNTVVGHQFSDNAGTNLMLSGAFQDHPMDMNDDGFTDVPVNWNINVLNRWKIETKKDECINLMFNYLHSQYKGGQMDYLNKTDDWQQKTDVYGFFNQTDRLYGYGTYGIRFGKAGNHSIGIQAFGTFHDYNSFYGHDEYITFDARQISGGANLKYLVQTYNEKHKFSAGLTFNHDYYDMAYSNFRFQETGLDFKQNESVPGAYFEYSWDPTHRFTAVVGLRYDYINMVQKAYNGNNSNFSKNLFSPKLHLRGEITEGLVARISGGKGYHIPHLSEFSNYFPSSRKMVFDNNLLTAEEAWNFGANLTWMFHLTEKREGSLSGDVYYTTFDNQLIADPYFDDHSVYLYTINHSTALTAQVSFNAELFNRFDFMASVRYNDVKMEFQQGLKSAPYVNKWKGLLTLGYATRHDKWMFNLTTQFNGDAAVPKITTNPEGYNNKNGKSEFYVMMHAQVTKNWRRWALYFGAENLLNYTQPNPIIAANQPYSDYFDASSVWGPLSGRMFYIGARYQLRK
ncbi:MAG: TonB-dependent receptor [Bacteroidales bacterium]|nr:TonB-dependent receptor [Bacteroidales bacterium]